MLSNVTRFLWVSNDDIEKETSLLKTRFSQAKSIPGTRSFHCFRTAIGQPGVIEAQKLSGGDQQKEFFKVLP